MVSKEKVTDVMWEHINLEDAAAQEGICASGSTGPVYEPVIS